MKGFFLGIFVMCLFTASSAQNSSPSKAKDGTAPAPQEKQREIFKVVENMPLFPGCSDPEMKPADRNACSNKRLMDYIFSNLKYPAEAKNNNVQGKVVVQFIVEKDGTINDVKVVRDIGSGYGKAVEDVIRNMNTMPEKWTPGKQRSQNVDVLITLPVEFKL